MSTQVDVLAVMDREFRVANDCRVETGSYGAVEAAAEATRARAALAELIEADAAVEALVAAQDANTQEALTIGVQLRHAWERRRRAVASVKGGVA